MSRRILVGILMGMSLVSSVAAADSQERQLVELPPMMRQHMLSNMRDHLAALQEILAALGEERYDDAARVAEQRLGMSSLESHGAAHMAQYMPEPMRDIGTEMHRAASRFAVEAENRGVQGDLGPPLTSLAEVMSRCAACHAGFRVH